MQKTPILQCRNLSKLYKVGDDVVVALKDVDIDVYAGQFVCIVGTSGSGKSTLLYLLAGIEAPSKGQIRIAEARIDKMTESEKVKFRLNNVGFIFQSFNLLPYQTALENVALPLSLKGLPSMVRTKKAAAMLKKVGLGERARHKPAQLSGGQQQRVSIARAIIAQQKIIFADEPTGNLDSHTGQEIMQLLHNEVKENGATLIMVTHDINNAKAADVIIKITDGVIEEIRTKTEEENAEI